jgi:hypothetical protein
MPNSTENQMTEPTNAGKLPNRALDNLGEIPRTEIPWTDQELVSLARLLSAPPAEPTLALIQAMKKEAA